PIVSIISRMTPQKGFDLIDRVIGDIMRTDLQFVFLGNGDKRYVDLANWAAWRYHGQVGTYIGMNEPLAHRIYAGSDMFLMPSQFEPCGLSQMISLRYGTVPIVRETGGLKDSIQPYNKYTDEGNGFSFSNYNAHEMLFTIERAARYYHHDKGMWQRMVNRGMNCDFGWNVSANKYISLYRSLTGLPDAEKTEEQEKTSKPAAKRGRKKHD
ncbi:MAG: glycosyltransferase, partial [Clostridia bacterium]|nr:glycosyltransferase [Clostridia bacterium]